MIHERVLTNGKVGGLYDFRADPEEAELEAYADKIR